MFQDALKSALSGNAKLVAREAKPGAEGAGSGGPDLPDPAGSEWVALLPRAPKGASLGRLRQETDAALKAMKAGGRRREAKALAKARDAFLKTREKAAWKATKARWAELGFSEKLYRRLKSEAASKKGVNVDVEKVVAKLFTRRAEGMGAVSQDELWDWISGK